MAKRGPKPREFTEDERRQVEMLAGIGLPQEQIASVLKTSVESLVKHCGQELEDGVAKANGKVAQFLFQQATKNLTAAIFWAKTRMRWRETDRLELTGKDGEELIPKLVINLKKRE